MLRGNDTKTDTMKAGALDELDFEHSFEVEHLNGLKFESIQERGTGHWKRSRMSWGQCHLGGVTKLQWKVYYGKKKAFTNQFSRHLWGIVWVFSHIEILIEFPTDAQTPRPRPLCIFLTILSPVFPATSVSGKVLSSLLVKWMNNWREVGGRLVKPNDGRPWMTRWRAWTSSYQQQKHKAQYTSWQISLLWGSLNILLSPLKDFPSL